MMLSNHYPVTYANSRIIPALVTCVIVAGALVRYFYNMWHGDHAKAPWWAWLVAAVAIWAAFWIATAASPGMRPALGLGEAAGQGRRGRRAEGARRTSSTVVEIALRDVPCARAGLGGDRRGAEGRAARHARAHRRASRRRSACRRC